MRPFTGTGLISALAMALAGQLPQPPLQARGTPSGAPGSSAWAAIFAAAPTSGPCLPTSALALLIKFDIMVKLLRQVGDPFF